MSARSTASWESPRGPRRPATLWNTTCCRASPSFKDDYLTWFSLAHDALHSVPFMHWASPHPFTVASSVLRRHPRSSCFLLLTRIPQFWRCILSHYTLDL